MRLKTITGIILLLFILSFIFIPSTMAKEETQQVKVTYNIGEPGYSRYIIYPDTSGDAYRIYLYWYSNITIDVYLLEEQEYYNYINGHTFYGVYENYGHSGVVDYTVFLPVIENTPYYVVLDHSDRGMVAPSLNATYNVAHVTLEGELVSDYNWLGLDDNTNGNTDDSTNGNTNDNTNDNSSDNSNVWVDSSAIFIIIIFIISMVILIVALVLYFGTKNKTPKSQRDYPPPSPPIQHSSEPRRKSVRAINRDEEKPKSPKYCPECGAPTHGKRFCAECGERMG